MSSETQELKGTTVGLGGENTDGKPESDHENPGVEPTGPSLNLRRSLSSQSLFVSRSENDVGLHISNSSPNLSSFTDALSLEIRLECSRAEINAVSQDEEPGSGPSNPGVSSN